MNARLESIARGLGGDVVGGGVNAPGPGHSKRDRSLRVLLVDHAPSGIWVESFAGDDWKVCRDYVRDRLGIRGTHLFKTRFQVEFSDNSERALAIWNAAKPIGGTMAEDYLADRGVDLAELPDLCHALRWHPACPWERGRHGCIVALFTDTVTGEPKAIHRTAITTTGQKIGRKMLGLSKGCICRVWPDEAVTTGLVIGEGIETTLAAATRIVSRGTYLRPAWAIGSAGNMSRFPPLAGVESLTILVDHDTNEAGQKAARECSQTWTQAGREVTRLTPKVTGEDFADIVTRGAV